MANEWKVSDADTFFEVYCDEQTHSYSLLSESEAHRLAKELDELHTLSEERRWRKIGEEWPEDGQWCQMLSNSVCPENFYFNASVKAWGNVTNSDVESDGNSYRMGCTFTHWRPMPMDVPKEEG